jgi:aspartate aminotransferase/aromatic-amino-acid transaminase
MTTTQNNMFQKTNLFQSAPLNPPDSIFGLIEMFKKDTREHKINLSVGVYQDESGATPVMKSVYA